MKTYRGSPTGARNYVESGRARADDYYLAEGAGIADRYAASPAAGVRRLEPLTGDDYEAWVAGIDPATGEPKGRLRHDARAVRFVEVSVNGPKSWSLAASLHSDISAAYDAAQDSAANQIIGWLARHATTRVGPRGGQVQVPVQEIEAAVVRHYTSRAGDPHRHLHLQINARVLAEGTWRGLHTIGVRDSIDAVNGIGHAAVMTDPGFRQALAAHGYTLDPANGEVTQLAEFVGPFSARAAQIGRNIERYEAGWRAVNAHQEPGPALRRLWDARAWADARPDKIVPRDGAELTRRWVTELHDVGFHAPTAPVAVSATSVGMVDRDRAVGQVLLRLAARRSGWNSADIRGEVEQLIARTNVVTAASVRSELAEDLTARTLAECVPLLDRDGVPEHIRALSSAHVLGVEADLTARLAARSTAPSSAVTPVAFDSVPPLDVPQQHAVQVLAGDAQLVVVEGAAGAGKTTTLAAARAAVEHAGHRLLVVTPTRKGAEVAARELGTPAFSAAWLVHQRGYRWDAHGAWSRLEPGEVDDATGTVYLGPSGHARLRAGDLLLVDEAGMCDQDTARALLTVADEQHVRVALVGDRHQLPAVGRGGVLDLAVRWADPDAHLILDTVHRFVCTTTSVEGTTRVVPDDEYAQLSLAMRTGEASGGVFDALLARGQIRVHASEAERFSALAAEAANAVRAGGRTVIVADTRDQVATFNAVIRDRLVEHGAVEDGDTVATTAGQCIGAGDRVATRRNDTDLRVANRDTWTVTDVHDDQSLTVAGERGTRTLPPRYVREHVELAYACTVHGVQGDTVNAAHLVVGEHTSAAAAYVGMTRGREHNTAHLVAQTVADAREQWIAAFSRDRADLGPAQAAEQAAHDAERYARHRPLEQVLGELRQAWTLEQDYRDRLAQHVDRRGLLRQIVPLRRSIERDLPALYATWGKAAQASRQAQERARAAERTLTHATGEIRDGLLAAWDQQRRAAAKAAYTVREGPGRFGLRRKAVAQAREQVDAWVERWRPLIPQLPTDTTELVAELDRFENRPPIWEQLDHIARGRAEAAHPDAVAAQRAAQSAQRDDHDAYQTWSAANAAHQHALAHFGNLAHAEQPDRLLAQTEQAITSSTDRLRRSQDQVQALLGEPAIRALPSGRIGHERDRWQADRDAHDDAAFTEYLSAAVRAPRNYRALDTVHHGHGFDSPYGHGYDNPAPQHSHGHGISR